MSCLIFGCRGIGRALAMRMSARGVPVHLASRSEDHLKQLASELPNTTYTVCDVTKEGDIKRAYEEANDQAGAIQGLAYAVGSIVLKPYKSVTRKDLMQTFELNAACAIEAATTCAPTLKDSGGSIVLFSTVACHVGLPNHTIIAAAKGAVESATRSLAVDLAPDVRVNCIAPSLTRSSLSASMTKSEAMANAIAAIHPLGRIGEPDDIASLAAFLLTNEDSGWITGQVIGVDGGRSTLSPAAPAKAKK
ncbi:unnamed protein product [Vitrella brassicaformis CCMP3155]|uniref:Uncharacterized protein n=2 Tax=Vitrella brassicaformis TaxID=1169539 RepID=A0A0G4ESQ3_VITBC|nr:unnamed protein product [Vitrella brassicaformis CCMP3155]|eukprot:CEM01672.1 unnamed protein product [Vitrella brassicaformis CCMP3155]